jgi:hypothetical protein
VATDARTDEVESCSLAPAHRMTLRGLPVPVPLFRERFFGADDEGLLGTFRPLPDAAGSYPRCESVLSEAVPDLDDASIRRLLAAIWRVALSSSVRRRRFFLFGGIFALCSRCRTVRSHAGIVDRHC